MPLYKNVTVNSQTHVKIWKITESFDDLFKDLQLRPESLDRVENMKSDIHRRGFLSVRYLLDAFGYNDFDLYYDENGKPHLKDGKYISITHSFKFSAIIVSNQPIGIDIEKQRDKIELIARKFVEYEFGYLKTNANDYIKKLTIIWCIKESLYKLYAQPGLSFKQHTLVIPFMINHDETYCWIDYQGRKSRYKASFFEFEGFTCSYVIG